MTTTGHTANDGQPVRRTALGRALAVLSAFGPQHRLLSLSEIARRADLTLPTTHRLASELVAWGALERHPSGHYFLGLRLLELAALAPRGLELREAAFPYLDDLHQATHSNVHLGVRDGHEVVYVETMRSRVSAQISSRVGDRWPLHVSGTGLVLLAYADPALAGRSPPGPAGALHAEDRRRPARAAADPGRDPPDRRGHRPRPDHHARGCRRGTGARPPQRRHRGDQRGRRHQRDAAEPPRRTGHRHRARHLARPRRARPPRE